MNLKTKLFYLTIAVFFLFGIPSYGQIYKLRANSVSYKFKIDGKWQDWAKLEKSNVLIVIDRNKSRITIYSRTTQTFDIAEVEKETTDKDGDTTIPLYCIDNDGKTCRVRLVKLYSQNGRKQLYVDYNDFRFVYNVNSLD